jgi:hypothetical protein
VVKGEVVMRRHGEDAGYDGQCTGALYTVVFLMVGLCGVGVADLLGLFGL